MIKIRLETKSAQFVQNVFIPPFNELPDVIIWGDRVFKFYAMQTYRECFAVMAIITEMNIPEEKEQIKETGNDDLLFGLPKTIDEAIETLMDFYLNAKDIHTIINMTENEFTASTHFGAGMFIRNSWYLWWQPNTKGFPATKPDLVKWFNDNGIYHADDMSAIIITSTYRKIHNKDLGLEKQFKHYIDYWKKQGFSDGNPMK